MKPVIIIGMGLTGDDLTDKHKSLINSADVLVGAKRHLEFFHDHPAKKREITKDLKGTIAYVKRNMKDKNVVVLTSGDPLFFGIGNLLLQKLGPENVVVCTNISSVAAAFARIKEPWNDARIYSLHGRDDLSGVIDSLRKNEKVAIFTDSRNNPARLARLLLDQRMPHYRICVLEKMGTLDECVRWYEPEEAVDVDFKEPNFVILKPLDTCSESATPLALGLPDKQYEHEKGLITKAEVRAVSLSKLNLYRDSVLWDLGSGSGSIAIEASLFIRKGRILAIEKDSRRIEQIKKNRKRFKVKNLDIVQNTLPAGLDQLPEPDRVFLGGGGQDIKEIIQIACSRLKPGGIIVANIVLIQNMSRVMKQFESENLDVDVTQVQISRGVDMPNGKRFQALNPVWIITGLKKNGGTSS